MKKVIIAVTLLISVAAIAQKGAGRNLKGMKDLSPDQIATLQTKKATLALDLTEEQQTQMKELFTKNATMRKAKMEKRKGQKERGDMKKLTAEERYNLAIARLDHQIEQKAAIKNILSAEQYEKWERMQYQKGKHRKKNMLQRKKNSQKAKK